MSRIWTVGGGSPVSAEDTRLLILTPAGRALIEDASATEQIATLGLDADIATLALPANTTISAVGKSLIDDATAADQLETLGLTASAAELNQLDGKTITAAGAELINDANAAAQLATLGAMSNADATVTYAKMQHVSATDKVLGRSTAGAGDVEEIACTAAGRALIDDATATAQLTTLGVTTAAKTVLDDTTVAAMLATLGGLAITPPNLVTNGEFETNTTGWASINATLSRETGSPLVGTGSLKSLLTANGGITYWTTTATVGHTYVVNCLAKSTAAAGRLVRIRTSAGTGTSVDASVSATLASLVFVANTTNPNLVFELVGGLTGESLLVDSVVCYDLTAWNPAPLQTQLDAKVAGSTISVAGAALIDDATAAAQIATLGITATAAELNALDGITATVAELNTADGVTSAIQTQLDDKALLGKFSRMTATENDCWSNGAGWASPLTVLAVASGTCVKSNGVANHPGLNVFKSSTTTNSGYCVLSDPNSPNSDLVLAGGETFEFIFRVDTNAGTTTRVGLHKGFSAADSADGVFIQIVDNVLVGRTIKSGAGAGTATTGTNYASITNTVFYRVKIVMNADATLATFTLVTCADGVQVWADTLNTYIPILAVGISMVFTNVGTTAVNLISLDWYRFSCSRVLVR